jgi:hypothetical protein
LSVGFWTYFVNSSTETNFGIAALDTNSLSVEVIWDQIVVQSTVADENRVDTGSNVEIRVTLWLAYDSSFLGSGDTVTLNGQAMTWDGVNSWFDLSVSQASIGLWAYFVNSSSETTYGITAINTNSQSTDVIWDEIVVQTTLADDIRVNIGDNVEIRVTLWLAYDSSFLGNGDTVTLAGQAMTWDSVNSWFDLSVSQVSVGLWNYFVNSSSESAFGITLLDTNSQSVDVVWDQIVVQSTVADDSRVNVGDNIEIHVTLWLAYDNSYLSAADSVTLAGQAMTWDGVNSWFDLSVSQLSVGFWTYFVNSSTETNSGITALDTSSLTVDVIWDQIVVQTTMADDTRVNIGDNVEIHVTLWLAYDGTYLGSSDTVTLDGQLMTWVSGNNRFELNVSRGSVGLWTYFVNSTTETNFGITALDTSSPTVAVIWDRVQVQSYSVSDGRVSLNENVDINVTLIYAYDSASVTTGTVTINGLSATHQGSGVWKATDFESAVIANIYDAVACSGNTYGITNVDPNGQSTSIIWDQLVITIGVDDSTPLNGVQANFSLSVIYDYDDTSCTTYQIVIQRNGTWWHSFTDANKSSFVDSNIDSSYTYTVFVVTSEFSYGVLSFSTNSQQVVWSAAPNSAPVNDTAPNLTNPDDTDNMYARYKFYIITSSVSDADGYNDIDYVELTLYDDSRTTPVWTVRYIVSGGIFSIVSGDAYINMSASSFAVGAGNNLDVTWYIKIDWDHSDLIDVDMRQYVYDGIIGDEDFYESNWDVETRLEITGLTVDDGSGTANRGPLDGAFTVSGTLIYLNSVDNYPLTNETDVWVSSTEYGTSTGPWSDFTLTSGQFSLTVYADDEVGQDTLTVKAVDEAVGSGGTDLLNSITQSTYIADQIAVQSYAALDPRINIDDTATIDVELLYEYDLSPVINGSVTINGITATHQGSGTWRFTDTKSSVQLFTYDAVAYSGGIHGLTQVNQNAMTQDVIWDQIVVQTTVADDTRINVGANVEIRVTLWLAYGSTFLGSGDSVTLNGTAMTWDSVNLWFDLTVSQASVGLWTYFVNSSSEATYGITNLDTNSQSVGVVWDQIVVQTTVVDDGRLDINANAEVRVTLWLAYDGSFLGAGDSVTLDGTATTWDGVNSWFDLTVSQSSVGSWLYYVNSTIDAAYGITSLDLNSQQVQVIWDEIVVQSTVADDTRVNMGANVEIRVTLWLAYDNTFLGSGDSVTLNGTAMTWDDVNSWFNLTVSQASVGLWTYFVNSSVDSTYDITELNLNSQSVDVVWDRIVVQTTAVNDGRVDVNANAEIHVTLLLEYDNAYLGAADSVTIDGTTMTWDSVNSWFELNVSQSSVGLWTYFVNSSTDSTYGIDLLALNGNLVSVIWDRVQVQSYSVLDDRVNVGDSVDIDVTLFYDYDDSPVIGGTITVNGLTAIHQGAGLWRVTDTEVSVIMNTYNTVVTSGNAYGLTVVDQNSQSQDVIWDQLVIIIGVDDASTLNGHQANFTLTVTFDYDDAVCATYQIAIDRNGTWWHSFIDSNVSLFVDTNTNATYLYNASLVSSESTYGITAFTTNTLKVTWSLAPNELPVNDSSPVLANGDDTDYLYARYRYYVITTSASDPDGYTDINYVELTLYSDDRFTSYWTIRYTAGSGFSVESGGSNVTIGPLSDAVGAGDTLTITWYIKIGWNHSNVVDTDILQFVSDGIADDLDYYETNWNFETRLAYSVAPSLSDDRGDVNTADLVGTGSVTYFGSAQSPFSNETDVWVIHDLAGAWNGDLVAGSFSISGIGSAAAVRMNTYTFKIVPEGAGSDGADLYYTTSLTDTFITDRIEIYDAGVVDGRININTNCEVWWRARYEYDSTEITSGLTLEITGSRILIWDAGNSYWRWQENTTSPGLIIFDVASTSETTYGLSSLSALTTAQEVIWDSLVITITDPVDQRINVGANATGIYVTAVYSYDGALFNGSFILNNTNFVSAVPGRQGYAVITTYGDDYGITAIGIPDFTYCIWDRVLVVSLDADEIYHDPTDDVNITIELQYEYDGAPVIAGTFAIAARPLTHIGGGVWEAQVTIGSYQSIDFDTLTACNATLHGISQFNMNSNAVTVYWDRLEFYSVSVVDSRINVGDSTDVEWSVRLENAGISITAGVTAQMTGPVVLTLSGGVYVASVTESTVGSVSYGILSATLGEMSAFVQTASDATVVWDRVQVTSITTTAPSVDIRAPTEIRVTLVYEFDSTPVTDGVVNLNDGIASVAMSYNSAGGYWSTSVTKTVAGNYTFAVSSVSGNNYGISSLNTAGLSVEVEWVGAAPFALDPMTLMIIGAGGGIAVLGAAIVASRRRRGGVTVSADELEPGDFGVSEPVAKVATTEPEIIEPEVEVAPEEVVPEAIEPTELESAIEPEVTVESVEAELPPMDEELLMAEELAVVPEIEAAEEILEPEEMEGPMEEHEIESEAPISEGPEVSEEPLPESELEPEPIEEPIVEPEVKPEYLDYDSIPEEFVEPKAPVDLSTLTKKELLELIPDDIRKTTSPNELKRLTKQELISLVESLRDIEE